MTSQLAAPRLTVRSLLAVPGWELSVVAGEQGLDRPLRWAHSTELLDPRPYLRGGELVLTVGVGLTTPERCAEFASAVAGGGGSAIGYGCGDVLPWPPEALVEECGRLGLPLLCVPPDVPFVAFTEWLAEQLAQAHDRRAARESAGRLIDLVREGLAAPAALVPILQSSAVEADAPLVVALRRRTEEVTAEAESEDVEPAGVLVATTPRHVVLLGGPAEVAAALEPPEAADEAAERAPAASGGTARGHWGVSEAHELARVATALTEAERALASATAVRSVVRHAELTTLSALLDRLPPDALRPFVDELAAPLIAYDQEHHSDLVKTLDAFVTANGSVADAARALYLHPNSVRLRLQRIRALTGRDPLALDDLIALRIACMAALGSRA